MNRRPVFALAQQPRWCALLALAGCGPTEPPISPGPRRRRPDPTSGASQWHGSAAGSTGSTASLDAVSTRPSPTWPATGCGSRSVVSVDYGRSPPGTAPPRRPWRTAPPPALPAGILTMAPDAGKGPAQVWVVDPGSNEILASVSVFRGPGRLVRRRRDDLQLTSDGRRRGRSLVRPRW